MDWPYLKTETGGYEEEYAVINLSSPLGYGPQSKIKSDQMAEFIILWSLWTIQTLESKHLCK